MCLKAGTIILLLLAALFSSAEIYRCEMENDKWLFTDQQCIDGTGQKIRLLPAPVNRQSVSTGLSKTEQQALANLNKKMTESRDLYIRQRKQIARQKRKNNKTRQQNCARAARQLDEIQVKRSHGYKLSEVYTLNRQTRELEGIRKANCRP